MRRRIKKQAAKARLQRLIGLSRTRTKRPTKRLKRLLAKKGKKRSLLKGKKEKLSEASALKERTQVNLTTIRSTVSSHRSHQQAVPVLSAPLKRLRQKLHLSKRAAPRSEEASGAK